MIDRSLLCLALIACALALGMGVARAGTVAFEAEAMSLPTSQGMVFGDAAAGGGRALLIWSNGTATRSMTTAGVRAISVRARGDQCSGAPSLTLSIDGAAVLTQAVAATAWTTYSANVAV